MNGPLRPLLVSERKFTIAVSHYIINKSHSSIFIDVLNAALLFSALKMLAPCIPIRIPLYQCTALAAAPEYFGISHKKVVVIWIYIANITKTFVQMFAVRCRYHCC